MTEEKRAFLIDSHSYLYRAYHAIPHLSNSTGIPTNATYAFTTMIRRLSKEYRPDMMVCVFDSKAPTFREDISKAYKAQRPPMPENLSVQIPYIKKILEAMGLPVLEMDGFEADDIIGTVAEQLKGKGWVVYIVTGDKDMLQLVSDEVFVMDSMKDIIWDKRKVEERYGVTPEQIVDYLALLGDASDNIPGVPGIGEKHARELIIKFGSIAGIYSRIDEIRPPSLKKRLIEGKELCLMSKMLATIRRDVPIDIKDGVLGRKEPDKETLKRIYRELEFTSLYKELKGELKEEGPKNKGIIVSDWKGLEGRPIGMVIRLEGRVFSDQRFVFFSISDGEKTFFSTREEDLHAVLTGSHEVIVHNLKPILSYLKWQGVRIALPGFFDTMLATYLINPMRKDYTLSTIMEEFLDDAPSGADDKEGAIEEACGLPELKKRLEEEMDKMGLIKLFSEVEMPLIEVLSDMERVGVKVDKGVLYGLSQELDRRLTKIIKRIYELAGEPFNINSPKQLSRVLFDRLGLPPVKRTKTGYSTDIEVLETLSGIHELPKEILEYRGLTKLKTTYIDVLPGLVNPLTGRIHTSYNQMVVATGRLSSSDPNLQNIPIRGEEARRIREAFVADEGFLIISSDYSQIELRVLAHISGDRLLIETFLADGDIHSRVAQDLFKVTAAEVTPEMRRTAKVINFGIVYGMSPYGLSKELGIHQAEAQRYIEGYFEAHKGVKEYLERVIEEARQKGYVKTLFGRIRYLPEINNPDPTIRQLGERAAMNTPIQGTAADIIKMAMVRIYREMKEKGLSSRLIMQIHDELVFEAKEAEAEEMEGIIIEGMEHVVELSVPLKVSIGKGISWAEAHP